MSEEKQTTVYTYTNTPEPPPVAPANARHSSKTVEHMTPPEIVERARTVLGGIDLDPFSTPEANARVRAERFFVGYPVPIKAAFGGGVVPCEHGMAYAVDGFSAHWGPFRRGSLCEGGPPDLLPPEQPARVFINPPGGRTDKNRSSQKRAWFKLAEEHKAGRVSSAIFVCFSVELLQTTQVKTPDGLPLPLDFPICYPAKRVRYLNAEGKVGKSPPHSSCLILLPERLPGSRGTWGPLQIEKFIELFGELGRVVVPWCARSI